jgi:ribosome-associated protein
MPEPSPAPFVEVREDEVDITAIRAQGAGGQNVNKVSSAIHLRFDIPASSLPPDIKERLLERSDSRVTKTGVLVLKAQQHRTQELNRVDALLRLHEIIQSVAVLPKARKPTKPTKASKTRTRVAKVQRSEIKALRGRVQG